MSRGAGGRTFPVLRWPDVALAQDIQQAEHRVHVLLVQEGRVLALGSSPSLHPLQHLDEELAWPFCNEVRVPAGTGPSAGERRPRSPAVPAAGPAGPERTGAVEEQQRSEVVQQLGQPVPPQVLAALLLGPRHPAVPGREAAAGPAGAGRDGAGGGRAEEPAAAPAAGRSAQARGKGEGKTDFPGSRHVSTGTDTPRSRPGPGSALVRGESKSHAVVFNTQCRC